MNDEYRREMENRIRDLEEESEALERKKHMFYKREEEEEWDIERAFQKTEDEASNCTSKDIGLLQLLDEKKNLLDKIKREKMSFYEEEKKWISDRQKELCLEKEDIANKVKRIYLGEEDKENE